MHAKVAAVLLGLGALALLGWIGVYDAIWTLLNRDPWLANAIAALFTAVATIFIAYYTRATKRMFELERGRHEAAVSHVIGECARCLGDIKVQRHHLEYAATASPIAKAIVWPRVIEKTLNNLQQLERQLDELESTARDVSAARVEFVRTARRLTREAETEVADVHRQWTALGEPPYGEDGGDDRRTELLEHAAAELEPLVDHLEQDDDVSRKAQPWVEPYFKVDDEAARD